MLQDDKEIVCFRNVHLEDVLPFVRQAVGITRTSVFAFIVATATDDDIVKMVLVKDIVYDQVVRFRRIAQVRPTNR